MQTANIYRSSSSFGFTHTQVQKITWWDDRGFYRAAWNAYAV